MIAAWMLWSIGAGLLFCLAGLAAEKLLKRGRRWVWLAAGAGTVALPAIRMMSGGGGADSSVLPAAPILLEPVTMTVASDSTLHSLDDTLLLAWVLLSAILLVAALMGGVRFLRRRASWDAGTLLGRDVLWSQDTGPAVVGLFGSCVVLPTWVQAAGAARQELILAHEEQHLRARDVHLRFLFGALLLAFAWNPAIWLQYRRLSLAIELDCDQRVMDRLPDHRRLYGDLLLRVGSGAGALPGIAVTALAEQRSLLERRIRQLLSKAPEVRMAQAAFLVFGAVLLIGVAVSIPGITGEGPVGVDGSAEEAGTLRIFPGAEHIVLPSLSSAPVFTPYTVKPNYVNAGEVHAALEREYPPLLRDAGIGGTVIVWFFIDEEGVVRNQQVQTSSGHQALDDAALRVAPVFRFTPALNRDQAVPVWVQLPITFTTGESAAAKESEAESAEEAAVQQEALRRATAIIGSRIEELAADEREISTAPVFTPYTKKPDYTNAAEVRSALEREYPPLLRDAGIGGTTIVWFFIDENGVVKNQVIQQSSGNEAMDEAALRVAPVFEFTPAENRGEPVPAWVQLPITFTDRDGADGAGAEASARPGFHFSQTEGVYVLTPNTERPDLRCALLPDTGKVHCRSLEATRPALPPGSRFSRSVPIQEGTTPVR